MKKVREFITTPHTRKKSSLLFIKNFIFVFSLFSRRVEFARVLDCTPEFDRHRLTAVEDNFIRYAITRI